MAESKKVRDDLETPPFSLTLPQVTPEEAATLREQITQRVFKPSGARPPGEVLPDPKYITVIDQGQEGVSVGVGIAAVMNYLRAEQGETGIVSPRMLYEFARIYDEWPGTDHMGSSVIGGLAGLIRHGVCTDKEWPLYGKDKKTRGHPQSQALTSAPKNRPSSVLKVDRNIDHLRAAIFEHHAVVMGAMIHGGWQKPTKGVIPFLQKKSEMFGGHAFAAIGYTSRGFIVQNSWGSKWGGLELGDRTVGGLAIWTYEDAEQNLNDAWIIQLKPQLYRAPLVGYDADTIDGDDLLEIKSEVTAFSYVLASRAVKPPLALGLFGDWGGGKTFFMQEMKKKIDSLAALSKKQSADQDKPSPFCSNIVQIKFNAWHYLDTDLWASLVTEIFDKLFQSIHGKTGKPEENIPRLSEELQTANGVYQQAKRQIDDAVRARINAENTLKDAVKALDAQEEGLLTQLDDLGQLLANNPAVKNNVDQLAQDLGIPELSASYQAVTDQAHTIKGLGNRFTGLLHTIFTTPWSPLRKFTLIAVLFSPVIVVACIEVLKQHFHISFDAFHSFAAQLSTFLTAVTAWLGAQAKRGAGVMKLLENTQKSLEEIRNNRRTQVLMQPESDLQALKAKEDAARSSLQEAELRVQVLERELKQLQPGRLIMRFIEERSKSEDYRSRLGIVSLVRRDFERLSELADPDSDNYNREVMPIQRIVLYIDDLDRCRPERVIEVLEAVHLLLAFRLFMVVVAVDPRWLRRCLEKHYPDLLVQDTQEVSTFLHAVSSRPATAQDYLEKIFQIPFTIQHLGTDGYRRLIMGLTELNIAPEVNAPLSGHGADAGGEQQGEFEGKSEKGEDNLTAQTLKDEQIMAHAKEQARMAIAEEETAENNVSAIERLRIRSWELKDMEKLGPLFHTPRSVKRFVNTYRFLRATVRPQYLPLFEGHKDTPGSYRAAMTLLAIVISYANVAPLFLKLIMNPDAIDCEDKTWTSFLTKARDAVGQVSIEKDETAQVNPDADQSTSGGETGRSGDEAALQYNWQQIEWIQLCDKLMALSRDDFPVGDIRDLEEWIYPVSRFSFSLASIPTHDFDN